MMRKTLDLLHPTGTIEVRAFPKKNQAYSGYYREREKLLNDVKKYSHLTWYIVMNQIDEACYSRSQCERIEGPYVTTTTGNADITRLRWLLIDVDPERTTGVSATDDEKAEALELIVKLQDYLKESGFPDAVFCDSGNGFHLLYKIDLPPEESKTIEQFLKVLDSIFSNEKAKVDTAVFNPSRVTKLYGTTAIKGSNTKERPHRESKILTIPKTVETVPVELIKSITTLYDDIVPDTKTEQSRSYYTGFDIERFLSENKIQIQSDSYVPAYRARKFVLSECVFDNSHKAPDACILQFDSGAICYRCLHDSCRDKHWQDVRVRFEPNVYNRQEKKKAPQSNSWGKYGIKNKEVSSTSPDRSFLSAFKTLDQFEEQEAEWLIDGWLAKGQINTEASEGGVGKTTIDCDIAAAISSGRRCFLDPPSYQREPQQVLFLSAEDSVRKKLKKKLRLAGANMKNIIAPDFSNDEDGLLQRLKFGSPEMAELIVTFKPALAIFDPIQGFLPKDVNMGSRNQMRDCLAPLISLGEKTGTTFLIVCHTNKRKNASGRDRLADSADLWDISRSVIMMGFTNQKNVRYCSHEKCNYGELQETKLFSINADGQIISEGTTWKRDRDFVQESESNLSKASREGCKEWVISRLTSAGGVMAIKQLDDDANKEGFSSRTLRRAKDELKEAEEIRYRQSGWGKEKTWLIERVSLPQEWSGEQ